MSSTEPTDTTITACSVDDLVAGEGLRVTSVSPPIAVFLTEDGQVFALDDLCTHQEASLADGWVEECWVECPLHASRFDLRTGSVDAPPAKVGVRRHAIEVRDGQVLVTLSTDAPRLPPGVTLGAGS
jgi:3-phenylpropionate/trans-cinnamate dioxygenase ferredoxin component